MTWTTIYVSSVTNGTRGKRLLEKQGYTVYLQRAAQIADDVGCGYSLIVGGDGARAVDQLRRAGIRVLRVDSGGAPR